MCNEKTFNEASAGYNASFIKQLSQSESDPRQAPSPSELVQKLSHMTTMLEKDAFKVDVALGNAVAQKIIGAGRKDNVARAGLGFMKAYANQDPFMAALPLSKIGAQAQPAEVFLAASTLLNQALAREPGARSAEVQTAQTVIGEKRKAFEADIKTAAPAYKR